MRVALAHNLRQHDTEAEAELDYPEAIENLAIAMRANGHEVVLVEVTCSLAQATDRLRAARPDIVFNYAAGLRGTMRQAVFPALYEDLGLPYTGSDGWTLCVSVDKSVAKLIVGKAGVPVARGVLARSADVPGVEALAPCILKPCYQSTSMGITDDSVVLEPERVRPALAAALRAWPDGILVEEYIPGLDVTVPYVAGLGPEIFEPSSYEIPPGRASRHRLFVCRNKDEAAFSLRCPAPIPAETAEQIRSYTRIVVRELRLLDYARLDFRIHDDGRVFFLEANAIPSMENSSGIALIAAAQGYKISDVIGRAIESAASRQGLLPRSPSPSA